MSTVKIVVVIIIVDSAIKVTGAFYCNHQNKTDDSIVLLAGLRQAHLNTSFGHLLP